MPRDSVFFKGDTVRVVKTYSQDYAREAFEAMSEAAQTALMQSLGIDHVDAYEDALWDELCEAAREDGHTCSFFVVTACKQPVFVAPDWPTAETAALGRVI
jgi:hypothetical protein